ncbi:hemolysin family protein [Kiritimatiellaeota bacterium B1221]|nr:hemolysin family protein [Kiritimatiellaeota bacterium B1221]
MNSIYPLCLTSLFGVTFFNTLLRSFRHSQDAGLIRLGELSPRFEKNAERWEKHWLEIVGLMTLIGGAFQITTIASSVLIYLELFKTFNALSGLVIFISGICYILLATSLPVVLSEYYADRITLWGLPVADVFYRVLFPFSFVISTVERMLHIQLAHNKDSGNRPSAGDEILTLVDQTRDHELDAEEKHFIRSALEFGETITREVMTPRVKMCGLEDTLIVEEAIREIQDSPYSRFPLFHDDYDEVLGMIHVKDLIQAIADGKMSSPLKELMKPATFVPESMPISDLLRMMKQKKIHTAIAVDEYGGTAGVVTLEDILEELVGEIEDEHDHEIKSFSEIRDGVYEVDATMPVDEANEELGLTLPEEEDYDTIAGYLLARLGRIPSIGEVVRCGEDEIRIKKATQRQIQTLTIIPAEIPEG